MSDRLGTAWGPSGFRASWTASTLTPPLPMRHKTTKPKRIINLDEPDRHLREADVGRALLTNAHIGVCCFDVVTYLKTPENVSVLPRDGG